LCARYPCRRLSPQTDTGTDPAAEESSFLTIYRIHFSLNVGLQSGTEAAGQRPFSPARHPPSLPGSLRSFRFFELPTLADTGTCSVKRPCNMRGTPITISERGSHPRSSLLGPIHTRLRITLLAGSAAILCTGGPDTIRKNAWPFCRTISGVRICWELEEPKG